MGFSVSWFAVWGKAGPTVWREAGLVPTGRVSEYLEEPICGRSLPGGWYLVYCSEVYHPLTQPGWLERLSAECDLVASQVHENCGISEASQWRSGKQLWSVSHREEEGPMHLDATGRLPDVYAEIRQDCLAKQEEEADVDHLFDIPVRLAASLVGFAYCDAPPEDSPFEVLEYGLVGGGTECFQGFNLILEGRPPVPDPSRGQIEHAIRLMSPRNGPGFAILEGPGQDYAQTAGGDGAFTVEWREYQGHQFQHWVAGHRGIGSRRKIQIPSNGFVVTICAHEQLNADETTAILLAFAAGSGRPAHVAWRETTSEHQ